MEEFSCQRRARKSARLFAIIRKSKENVVLNIDTEHLDFAPFLDPARMNHREYEASIYEYYGIQPYWTELTHCSK